MTANGKRVLRLAFAFAARSALSVSAALAAVSAVPASSTLGAIAMAASDFAHGTCDAVSLANTPKGCCPRAPQPPSAITIDAISRPQDGAKLLEQPEIETYASPQLKAST